MHSVYVESKIYPLPLARPRACVDARNQRLFPSVELKIQETLSAETLDKTHVGVHYRFGRSFRKQLFGMDILGANPHNDVRAIAAQPQKTLCASAREWKDSTARVKHELSLVVHYFAVYHIHYRFAEKSSDKSVRRIVVEPLRSVELPKPAVLYYRDALAERHRVRAVVYGADDRRAEKFLYLSYIGYENYLLSLIQPVQNIVEKHRPAFAHERATKRDASEIDERQFYRPRLQKVFDIHKRRRFPYSRVDFLGRIFAEFQTVSKTIVHASFFVRDGIFLRHERYVSFLSVGKSTETAVDIHIARRRRFETADYPKRSRTAASHRSGNDRNLAFVCIKRKIFKRAFSARKGLVYVF